MTSYLTHIKSSLINKSNENTTEVRLQSYVIEIDVAVLSNWSVKIVNNYN